MSSLHLVTLDSQLNCWVYGYHITFGADVEDMLEVCTLKELDLLLRYETK